MKTCAIITAGGTGKRFGAELPKQFAELTGVPIIVRSIVKFEMLEEIDSIVITIHPNWSAYLDNLLKYDYFDKIKDIVHGGDLRQDSIRNALKSEAVLESDIILIHDAVRPLASVELIQKIINETKQHKAVIPVIPVKDTIKQVVDGKVSSTLNRKTLFGAQTPQGFKKELIISAYETAYNAGFISTDDASVAEFASFPVHTTEGEENNIKITTKLDLQIAELILRNEKNPKKK